MKEIATKEINEKGGLTDEQRDEVRSLLGKYVKPAQRTSRSQKLIPDPLRGVPPGTTIEIQRCVGEAIQHRVILETRISILPFLLDRIETSPEEIAMVAQQILGGEIKFENNTVVIQLEQGRPVASVRISMIDDKVVNAIQFEVA